MHAELRMEQRGVSEVDVRSMLHRARGHSPSIVHVSRELGIDRATASSCFELDHHGRDKYGPEMTLV
jgi:hypothetical protein